jgi:hypothetical protein
LFVGDFEVAETDFGAAETAQLEAGSKQGLFSFFFFVFFFPLFVCFW